MWFLSCALRYISCGILWSLVIFHPVNFRLITFKYFCLEINLNYISLDIEILHNEFQTEILRVVRLKKVALVCLIKLSIYSSENFRYFNSKSFQ